MVAAFAGDELEEQVGIGGAAVIILVVLVLQPVALPPAFFGTTYQRYNTEPINPVGVYELVVTVAKGDVGEVVPVHKYTSYDVAVAAAFQVSVAVL